VNLPLYDFDSSAVLVTLNIPLVIFRSPEELVVPCASKVNVETGCTQLSFPLAGVGVLKVISV